MLVIWGRNSSVNVQKVRRCCEELALPYARIDAGGPFGDVGTPECRRLNPNGLVPTIDDGSVLWESNAIVRNLAAKHGAGRLWPDDPGTRALGCGIRRWMALPIDRPGLPHVHRCFDAPAQRPAYRKVVMQPLA